MEKSRVVRRDELGEDSLRILREFDEWFLPATMEEAGNQHLMFLKWLEDNGYKIVRNDE
jgi:hypothetical protein